MKKETENPEIEVIDDKVEQTLPATVKEELELTQEKWDFMQKNYQINRSTQEIGDMVGAHGQQSERVMVPKQQYKFFDEGGVPRSVKVAAGVTWDPLDKVCEYGYGCSNIAYNQCNGNLDNLGFPNFTKNWNGCNNFHCIIHTYFRPNIHSKPVYRCRGQECNNRFYETLHKWQNARCIIWSILIVIILTVIYYGIYISRDNSQKMKEAIVSIVGSVIVIIWAIYTLRKKLIRPYTSNRQQLENDGMEEIHIFDRPGYYDYNCYEDGYDKAENSALDFGGSLNFGELSVENQGNMMEMLGSGFGGRGVGGGDGDEDEIGRGGGE